MTAPVAENATPHTAHLSTGDILAGRYRMVSRIGRGELGEVWKADDLTLGVPVALKLIRSATPAARTRLFREARLTRLVPHPSVCRVFDAGEADGTVFFSMELVSGEDLSVLLRRTGRFPSERVAEIAQQLCAGVGAAHAAGIVHHNLGPASILLDDDGQVRITGFGGGSGADDAGPAASHTDVRAIGLVLYELVTGRPLEPQASQPTGRRLPSPLAPDICPGLERAILSAVAANPDDRPATPRALAALLPCAHSLQRLPGPITNSGESVSHWLADATDIAVAGVRAACLLVLPRVMQAQVAGARGHRLC